MLVNAEVTNILTGEAFARQSGFANRDAAWQWIVEHISEEYPQWSEKIVQYSETYKTWWTPIDLNREVSVRVWEDR